MSKTNRADKTSTRPLPKLNNHRELPDFYDYDEYDEDGYPYDDLDQEKYYGKLCPKKTNVDRRQDEPSGQND